MRRKAWTFNVSVDFWDHHKSVAAGRDGRDLFLCAIGWSGKERTNGHIPTAALGLLAGKVGISPAAARKATTKLLEVGLLEPHPVDGWLIHDYCGDDGWQLSAEERDAQAANSRDRKRKSRVTPPVTPPVTPSAKDAQRVLSPSIGGFTSSSSALNGHASDDDDRIDAALAALGRHDHDQAIADGVPIKTPPGHLAACIRGRRASDHAPVRALAAEHPDWTAEQLADARLGAVNGQANSTARPELVPFQPPTIAPDPALNTAKARAARSALRGDPA